MSVLHSNALAGASSGPSVPYTIARSLRFNAADSAYLTRTPSVAGSTTTWTWCGWVKRSALGTVQSLFQAYSSATLWTSLFFTATNTLRFEVFNSGVFNAVYETAPVYTDCSSWYHIWISVDTTQTSFFNAFNLYVNGNVPSSATLNVPVGAYSQGMSFIVNSTVPHRIGFSNNTSTYFSGYMAEVYFIDGLAVRPFSIPSAFHTTDPATTEVMPVGYTGSYGTNGFKLNFADNSAATAAALGKDTSGNGNNFTPVNFSVTAGVGNDSLTDTPTSYGTDTGLGGEVRGNYATLNPLNAAHTYANGNLDVTTSTASYLAIAPAVSSIPFYTGKWYVEFTLTSVSAGCYIGVTFEPSTLNYIGGDTNSASYYSVNGNKYNAGIGSAYGSSFTTNDVIGIAVNFINGTNCTIFFSKNGVWQASGNPVTGSSPAFTFFGVNGDKRPFFLAISKDTTLTTTTAGTFNFGARPFAYTAPEGFKALCDTNLLEPAIKRPVFYSNNSSYVGNAAFGTIFNSFFIPDLVWIKGQAATDHAIYDSVRGATLDLTSSSTAGETTQTTGLTSFNTNGYITLGTLAKINTTSASYQAYTWYASPSNVTNTSGSITSTLRANPTSGFSIVTYTGTGANATIGHGLGVAPDFIIVKSRGSNGTGWAVFHILATASNQYCLLNTTAGRATDTTVWNNSLPTSSVFPVGTSTLVNQNTINYVAYCFAQIPGYSSFGTYTGNGSTDGTFVHTGFRPAWVMIKSFITGGVGYNWVIYDLKRGGNPGNTPANSYNLSANLADAQSLNTFEALSNGFKIRNTQVSQNGAATAYMYVAFANTPFKYTRGV